MENNKDFAQRLKEEGLFWGRFQEEANRYGVPWWCDLRRATKLTKVISGWMYDPEIEKILRGYYKDKLINDAAKIKGNVLDVGCGAGWLSLELARKGMDVDAIDISNKQIEIAKEFLKNNPCKEGFGSINYQTVDVNKISLEKQKYQSVVCWDILHHVSNIDRLMQEIHYSLKPGRYFVIYDHIGLRNSSRLLITILRIPFIVFHKIKRIFKAADKDQENGPYEARQALSSPFEDVTSEEMIYAIKRYFDIEILETQLCFLAGLANDLIKLPNILKYSFLRMLKCVDDLLIKMQILKGEYVFVMARRTQ